MGAGGHAFRGLGSGEAGAERKAAADAFCHAHDVGRYANVLADGLPADGVIITPSPDR